MRNSEFQPHPAQLLRKLDAHWKAKLGPLYGKFFVAPGVRWPSEFNAEGAWEPLPPKKPAESVRFAREEEGLKQVNGAELEFRAAPNSVTGPSLMAATALASHNSDGQNSEKERPLLLADDVKKLIGRLDIPHHLRRTLWVWWGICTQPHGREIRLWKGVDDFARAAQVCPRTARYHLRHFERMELIEVAVDSTGKKLVANTINRPTTYRLRNETLLRNRWPECRRCGHKHKSEHECGCNLPERVGSFYTKDGKRISKVVGRTCRCKPSPNDAPTPIRPQRSAKHFSQHSSESSSLPAQEAARPQQQPVPAAPVPVAAPIQETSPLRKENRSVREIRKAIVDYTTFLMQPGAAVEHTEVRSQCELELPGSSIQPKLDASPDPWAEVLNQLRRRVNPHTFDTWLKPSQIRAAREKQIFVTIPSREFAHIGEKFHKLIAEAVAELCLGYEEIVFEWSERVEKTLPALSFRAALVRACEQTGIPLEAALEATGWKKKFEESESS